MTDLSGLLERVSGAEGKDLHLDAMIEVEARRQEAYRVGLDDSSRAYWNATIDGLVYDTSTSYPAPRYTASIDASLALVERCLPDTVRPGFQQNPDRSWSAAILRVQPDDDECPVADAKTAPLAILAALLSALSLKEQTE